MVGARKYNRRIMQKSSTPLPTPSPLTVARVSRPDDARGCIELEERKNLATTKSNIMRRRDISKIKSNFNTYLCLQGRVKCLRPRSITGLFKMYQILTFSFMETMETMETRPIRLYIVRITR